MKTSTKTKNTKKKSIKTKAKSKLAVVRLTYPKRTALRHLRLVESKHTGKLIHHRHTSHLALVIILVFVGVFLFVNQSFVVAQQITSVGSVSVGAVVPGPPPTVGATILSPTDKAVLKVTTVTVSGSCLKDALVVVYDNAQAVGSAICTSEGIFSLVVQLKVGDNALQAMNYDSINRPGPATPVVTVKVEQINTDIPVVPVIAKPVPPDSLENPAIIPAVTPSKHLCDSYDGNVDTSTGGPLEVSVVCMIRGLQIGEKSVIGLTVHGGQPPYAVNIDLGNDNMANEDDVLISVPDPGYKAVPITYSVPGQYTVKVKAKDTVGQTSIVQTVVEVNGIAGLNTFASIEDTVLNTSWLQTSVPVYLLVLVLTLGFWVGDIFNRHFGANKLHKQQRHDT
jgi:hypothetical protein